MAEENVTRKLTAILYADVAGYSRLTGEDEVGERLRGALDYIDRNRLVAAPDCGLGLLGRDLTLAKLNNLCAAARSVS